jgi:hypothetical protein
MLQEQAQLELALTCAENAIELDPNFALAHWRKSSVLWAQKRKDESIAAFVRVHCTKVRRIGMNRTLLADVGAVPSFDAHSRNLAV